MSEQPSSLESNNLDHDLAILRQAGFYTLREVENFLTEIQQILFLQSPQKIFKPKNQFKLEKLEKLAEIAGKLKNEELLEVIIKKAQAINKFTLRKQFELHFKDLIRIEQAFQDEESSNTYRWKLREIVDYYKSLDEDSKKFLKSLRGHDDFLERLVNLQNKVLDQ